MILTEKGSTRGTMSVLLLAALIFLAVRFIVNAIETSVPKTRLSEINWRPVNDIMKENEDVVYELAEVTEKDKDGEAATPLDTAGKKKQRRRFALERVFPDNDAELPVLIYFSDDTSVISKKMEQSSLGVPEVREKIEREFYPIKIRFDRPLTKTEYKIYQNYGSAAAPLLVIRSATGEDLTRAAGCLSAVKIMVLLNKAKAKLEKLKDNLNTGRVLK